MNTTTTTTPSAGRDQVAELEALGYIKGEPPWCLEACEIDRDVVKRMKCPHCRTRFSLAFSPYHHPGKRRYRVLLICRECGGRSEF
jgi:hypothetical protein